MPKLLRFQIKNFRGIQEATIIIDEKQISDVITLIGLNESGKTTVLEALSHFSTGDRTIPNLLAQDERADYLISLLPIHLRSNFTGEVSVSADILVSEDEVKSYANKLGKTFGMDVKVPDEFQKINVKKSYSFIDSKYIGQVNYWTGVNFQYKSKRAKIYRSYDPNDIDSKTIWNSFIGLITEDFYELVYFPTFIVDMPERIYLEPHSDETDVNKYYRKVIEDVLYSIDPKLSLERHIIDRLKEAKQQSNSAAWFSVFWGKPERKLVDSVLEKIQAAINKEVIGNWSKVFSQSVGTRAVKLEWNVDAEKRDIVYLSFGVSDGISTFAIHERSLGFRWFFSYLLFTQFRSKGEKKTIFLFDEPAANLHAKAQMQLLSSIEKIVESDNKVVYSTHSPHMINPNWLHGALIVENLSVDFDKGEDINGFDTSPTNIKAIKYGRFVSEYPEKRTYFQPVWEKLLYTAPPIIGEGPYLCLEGISDFHLFRYVLQTTCKKVRLSIVPGVGAGGYGNSLPALYGSGARFLLLLDDDRQGQKEKKRYIEEGIMAQSQVCTYGDVIEAQRGKKLESLLSDETRKKVQARFSGKGGKEQVAMYLAEACATSGKDLLSTDTFDRVEEMIVWAAKKLAE